MDLNWNLWSPVLRRAESDLADDLSNLDLVFLELPLELFGVLMLSVPKQYPRLRQLLPRMPDDDVQRAWAGDAGLPLLWKGTSFVRASVPYFTYKDCRAKELRALDFGCGWGRLLRLFYKYFPPCQIEAVDPWDKSIEACKASGIKSNVVQSEYLPEQLPTINKRFDLIYSYSVFTHLSPRAFATCLSALRRYIADNGVLIITIRPVEYWLQVGKPECVSDHAKSGFCFIPHAFAAIDGDSVYGDCSISLDYLKQFDQWVIEAVDVSYTDPLQVFVVMRPAAL